MDDLDRDRATQHPLLGSVHSPHATDTDQLQDAVRAADRPPDEGIFGRGIAALGGSTTRRAKAITFAVRSAALMAQRHGIQDSADLSGSKAFSNGEPHPALVLGLGVNVWVTHVLLGLVSYGATPLQYFVGACSLLCLLLGVAARMTREGERWRRAVRWLLLCVFPALIGLSLSLGSEQIRETAYTALSMPLCAASLLAYVAAAVVACRQDERPLETQSHALNGRESLPAPARLRRFVIGVCLCGAFVIAVIAPLIPRGPEVAEAWGDAAAAGAVLSALTAVAIAVSVVVVHLGSALRKSERPHETRRQRQQRLATLLFLTLLGFVTYFTVVP
jgi:hypothetical protein